MTSNGFEHSVKVPRLYKIVKNIVQKVQEEGASLKQLVYENKHPNIRGLYALALTTLQNGSHLDHLIRSTRILFEEPRLDPWLARVLITELLWGKQRLQSESKPVKTILLYQTKLQKYLKEIVLSSPSVFKKVDKPRYVRVNTLYMSVSDVISAFAEEGWNILPKSANYDQFIESISNLTEPNFVRDIHIPELLIFPSGTPFHDHEAYNKGAIVLQDKASCFPAFLLGATPGSVVMDMCAAPGMKTTHLAAILQNKGKIYAVERDLRRYETLRKMLEATKCSCVESINADVITIDSSKCPDVEYILVDPSCSGSGMTDRLEVDGVKQAKCAPARIKSLQSFQVLILRHALLNFPKAKRIVYSTCSIYPEENEQVVDEVLSTVGDAYRLVPVGTILDGNWRNFSSKDYACEDKCLYARSETDMTNGFFVAIFERNFEVPLPESGRKKKKIELHEENKGSVSSEKEKKKKQKKKRRNAEESESVPNVDPVPKDTSNASDAMTVDNSTDSAMYRKEKKKNRKKRKRTADTNFTTINEDSTT
ncbi:probable 28S rRNA (cytosine-C(5))-methyltransferase isoform X2 [Cephus cinctus]|nr:probable 28S rRNA (cytosine-C(5))-methyltransferase isoform X2 [Cephus cinctus]